MVHSKLSDYLLVIKYLIDSQETLLEYQTKVDTLVRMVSEKDLIDYPALKLHVYLRALRDSVDRAISFTDDIMKVLNKLTTLLMEDTRDSGCKLKEVF